MKKGKFLRIISFVVVLCMIFSLTAFAAPKQMNFEKSQTKFTEAEEYMTGEGHIKGDGYGNYFWGDYVKRGDITLMIVRAFKLSMISDDGNFDDVDSKDYYYNAIATAKAHGIAKGDGKHFNPKKYVSIGEAILLIERAVNVANSNVTTEIDAKEVKTELRELYDEKDLNNFATRDDIANMLYYVLTNELFDKDYDEYDDAEMVEFTVEAEEDYVKFNDEDDKDFDEVFDEFIKDNDKHLDYVKFELPKPSQGTLYYNYDTNSESLVKTSDKYFSNENDDEKSIENVSFVPNVNYSGTFYLAYTAYDDGDDLYRGLIKITVVGNDEEKVVLNNINYTINDNDYDTANFILEDFEKAFEDKSNEDLNYIKFKLPDDKYGTLYYKYDVEGEDAVNEDEKIDGNEIEDVTFVPDEDFAGTVFIDYTAFGNDDSFTGQIKIVVKDKYDIQLITLNAEEDVDIDFDAKLDGKIESAFENSTTNKDLEFVQFELPKSEYGTLYFDEELVEANDKFEVDEIDDITLELKDNYNGTFLIQYTAIDTHDDSYSGLIKVIVEED